MSKRNGKGTPGQQPEAAGMEPLDPVTQQTYAAHLQCFAWLPTRAPSEGLEQLTYKQFQVTCPVCRQIAIAMPGFNVGMYARLEDLNVDLRVHCCGVTLSLRTFLAAQAHARSTILAQ